MQPFENQNERHTQVVHVLRQDQNVSEGGSNSQNMEKSESFYPKEDFLSREDTPQIQLGKIPSDFELQHPSSELVTEFNLHANNGEQQLLRLAQVNMQNPNTQRKGLEQAYEKETVGQLTDAPAEEVYQKRNFNGFEGMSHQFDSQETRQQFPSVNSYRHQQEQLRDYQQSVIQVTSCHSEDSYQGKNTSDSHLILIDDSSASPDKIMQQAETKKRTIEDAHQKLTQQRNQLYLITESNQCLEESSSSLHPDSISSADQSSTSQVVMSQHRLATIPEGNSSISDSITKTRRIATNTQQTHINGFGESANISRNQGCMDSNTQNDKGGDSIKNMRDQLRQQYLQEYKHQLSMDMSNPENQRALNHLHIHQKSQPNLQNQLLNFQLTRQISHGLESNDQHHEFHLTGDLLTSVNESQIKRLAELSNEDKHSKKLSKDSSNPTMSNFNINLVKVEQILEKSTQQAQSNETVQPERVSEIANGCHLTKVKSQLSSERSLREPVGAVFNIPNINVLEISSKASSDLFGLPKRASKNNTNNVLEEVSLSHNTNSQALTRSKKESIRYKTSNNQNASSSSAVYEDEKTSSLILDIDDVNPCYQHISVLPTQEPQQTQTDVSQREKHLVTEEEEVKHFQQPTLNVMRTITDNSSVENSYAQGIALYRLSNGDRRENKPMETQASRTGGVSIQQNSASIQASSQNHFQSSLDNCEKNQADASTFMPIYNSELQETRLRVPSSERDPQTVKKTGKNSHLMLVPQQSSIVDQASVLTSVQINRLTEGCNIAETQEAEGDMIQPESLDKISYYVNQSNNLSRCHQNTQAYREENESFSDSCDASSTFFDERVSAAQTVRTKNESTAGVGLFQKCKRRSTTKIMKPYQTRKNTLIKKSQFPNRPTISQMKKLAGDHEVQKTTIIEEENFIPEPNQFHRKQQPATDGSLFQLKFRNPNTKEIFMRASLDETQEKMQKLSMVLSEQDISSSDLVNNQKSMKDISMKDQSVRELSSDELSNSQIAGQEVHVVRSILVKMLQFQQNQEQWQQEVRKSQSNQLRQSIVDVQWTKDEMKALTTIFKDSVQHDLERKNPGNIKPKKQDQKKGLHVGRKGTKGNSKATVVTKNHSKVIRQSKCGNLSTKSSVSFANSNKGNFTQQVNQSSETTFMTKGFSANASKVMQTQTQPSMMYSTQMRGQERTMDQTPSIQIENQMHQQSQLSQREYMQEMTQMQIRELQKQNEQLVKQVQLLREEMERTKELSSARTIRTNGTTSSSISPNVSQKARSNAIYIKPGLTYWPTHQANASHSNTFEDSLGKESGIAALPGHKRQATPMQIQNFIQGSQKLKENTKLQSMCCSSATGSMINLSDHNSQLNSFNCSTIQHSCSHRSIKVNFGPAGNNLILNESKHPTSSTGTPTIGQLKPATGMTTDQVNSLRTTPLITDQMPKQAQTLQVPEQKADISQSQANESKSKDDQADPLTQKSQSSLSTMIRDKGVAMYNLLKRDKRKVRKESPYTIAVKDTREPIHTFSSQAGKAQRKVLKMGTKSGQYSPTNQFSSFAKMDTMRVKVAGNASRASPPLSANSLKSGQVWANGKSSVHQRMVKRNTSSARSYRSSQSFKQNRDFLEFIRSGTVTPSDSRAKPFKIKKEPTQQLSTIFI